MTPETLTALRDWYDAMTIVRTVGIIGGLFGFLGSKTDEDEIIAQANELCCDMVADADQVRTIELETGQNLRDQLSVGEAIDMAEDAEGRRNGWRWS